MYNIENNIQQEFLNDIRECGMSLVFRQLALKDLDVFDKYEQYIKEEYEQDEYIDAVTSCQTAHNCNTLTPDLLLLTLGQFTPLLVVEDCDEEEEDCCGCCDQNNNDKIYHFLCQQDIADIKDVHVFQTLDNMNPKKIPTALLQQKCYQIVRDGLSLLQLFLEKDPVDKNKIIKYDTTEFDIRENHDLMVDTFNNVVAILYKILFEGKSDKYTQLSFCEELYQLVILAATIILKHDEVIE